MYEINKFFFRKAFEETATGLRNRIPAHVGYFILMLLRNKAFHVNVKNTETVHISFLRMAAHQLHTQTDTQHRLTQFLYQPAHSTGIQEVHGGLRLTHSWKNNFIRSP